MLLFPVGTIKTKSVGGELNQQPYAPQSSILWSELSYLVRWCSLFLSFFRTMTLKENVLMVATRIWTAVSDTRVSWLTHYADINSFSTHSFPIPYHFRRTFLLLGCLENYLSRLTRRENNTDDWREAATQLLSRLFVCPGKLGMSPAFAWCLLG